ncbi:MAG: spondin domain-containing protein [Candidatus Bipolaricaulia bacterium]
MFRKLTLAALILAVGLVGPQALQAQDMGSDGPVTFQVTIRNVGSLDELPSDAATGGAVWITPGAYAVHHGSNPIFTEGAYASDGLEALAEAGPPTGTPQNQPGLVATLGNVDRVSAFGAYTPGNTIEDPNDPMGSVPGAPPIAPSGSFQFTVEAEPGDKLSFASMFVPSNDLFLSPHADGIRLFNAAGEPVNGTVRPALVGLYDAGTEVNQEPGFGPDSAPIQDGPDQGKAEGQVVRPVSDVDDGFSYSSVEDTIQIHIQPQR